MTRPARFAPPRAAALAVLLPCGALVAQTKDDGDLWAAVFAQGHLGAKDSALAHWRWWLDVQDRQRDEGESFDLLLVRPGLGYVLTEHWSVWAGTAWIVSDPVGRGGYVEHRPWQQVNWNGTLGDVRLVWRNRLEERFVEGENDFGWRFRSMLRGTMALGDGSPFYAAASNEVFFDLEDTTWRTGSQREGFRQNRAYAGLGWWVDEAHHFAVEVGYLNQWVDRPPSQEDRLNHVLSIGLWLTF